jgi:hypothetical protein
MSYLLDFRSSLLYLNEICFNYNGIISKINSNNNDNNEKLDVFPFKNIKSIAVSIDELIDNLQQETIYSFNNMMNIYFMESITRQVCKVIYLSVL